MTRLITIDLADKPEGWVESAEAWIAAWNGTDRITYAELGAPKVRQSDRNEFAARLRRTDLDKVCAHISNPQLDKERGTLVFEVYPTGPFAHLLERFYTEVTLGARMVLRRGVVEAITHFDFIPATHLKELIDEQQTSVLKHTRTAGQSTGEVASRL